ncbi:hypothetical protein BLA29_011913, partial [Euroglyphus maynei]
INKSEGGHVVITETNKKTTGNYKCEISVDGTFQTVAAEKSMIVMDFWNFYTSSLGNNGADYCNNNNNHSMITMIILLVWFHVLIIWRHHWHHDIVHCL